MLQQQKYSKSTKEKNKDATDYPEGSIQKMFTHRQSTPPPLIGSYSDFDNDDDNNDSDVVVFCNDNSPCDNDSDIFIECHQISLYVSK